LDGAISPGEYLATVILRDNVSSEEASFTRRIRIKPPEFTFIGAGFFRDKEAALPIPPVVYAGEDFSVQFYVLNIDKHSGRLDVEVTWQMLDSEENELFPPNAERLSEPVPPHLVSGGGGTDTVKMQYSVPAPGEYSILITLTDKATNRTIHDRVSVRVIGP
jgi:hypothetical protein